MLDWPDIALRLGAATAIGGAIGLNRDLHRKSAGVRTVGVVALASAAVTLGTIMAVGPDGAARVIQGLVTGIGFLGAGVIVHGQGGGHKVHGLTTAAAIWAATAIGALCAMGLWPLTAVTVVLMFTLLTLGGRLEKWLHGTLAGEKEESGDEGGRNKP